MPSATVYASNLTTLNGAAKSSHMIPDVVEPRPSPKKKDGMTFVLLVTSLAALISAAFPTGYSLGVMNAPEQILQEFCNASVYSKYDVALTAPQLSLLWSFVVSVFLICCMLGNLLAGTMCNKYGRKKSILMVNSLAMVGAALFALCQAAESVEMLILARILVGIHGGFATSAVPMYLTEIAPPSARGTLGVFLLIGVTLGILVAQVFGLDYTLGTEARMPYLLSIFVAPLIVGTLVLICCPESPKYLYIVKGRTEKAFQELCRFRGKPLSELDDDVAELKKEAKDNLKMPTWTYVQLLTCRELRKPLALICILHLGNQLSGIGAVFYYSTAIFKSAGLSQLHSQYASIGAGMANLSISLGSVFFVSRFGRRPLYLTSIFLTAACLAGMTVSFVFVSAASFVPYVAIALLIVYVLVFGIGIGNIPFFIGSELFQPGPRPTAMSLGCVANSICNFLVAATFPTIQSILGDYSFTIFIASLLVIGLFLLPGSRMPETKDRTFEEIMADFGSVPRSSSRPSQANVIDLIINSDVEDAAIIQSSSSAPSKHMIA